MYFSFCFAVISAQQSKFITYGIGKENKTLIEDRLKKKKKKTKQKSNLVFHATYRFNPTVFCILGCGGKGKDWTFFTCIFSLDLVLSVPTHFSEVCFFSWL